jgi:hypothetical protein
MVTLKSLGISLVSHYRSPDVASWVEDNKLMNDLLHQHLHHAQQRLKHQAVKK